MCVISEINISMANGCCAQCARTKRGEQQTHRCPRRRPPLPPASLPPLCCCFSLVLLPTLPSSAALPSAACCPFSASSATGAADALLAVPFTVSCLSYSHCPILPRSIRASTDETTTPLREKRCPSEEVGLSSVTRSVHLACGDTCAQGWAGVGGTGDDSAS